MPVSNNVAFKEWAVVCEALGSGRQSLILRKGGLHGRREGFRVAHRQFWLPATRYHQAAEDFALAAVSGLLCQHTGGDART